VFVSVMDGIRVVPSAKWNSSVVFPCFSTRDLDFAGLKFMQAQVIISSRPFRIHLLPGTDVVVIVRLSMKARMGGCRTSEFVRGPLH